MTAWKRRVRAADFLLRLESKRIETWRDLWTAPFYAWLRRSLLRREPAWDVAQRKLDALLERRDRIARRFGR